MRNILSLGLVRAFFGLVLGTAIGYGLITAIRLSMGLQPDPEPSWVLGAIFGVIGALLAAGVLTDWIKWTFGIETPLRHGAPEGKPNWTRYFSVGYNHKAIGAQYGTAPIFLLLAGGMRAIIFRLELALPGLPVPATHPSHTPLH